MTENAMAAVKEAEDSHSAPAAMPTAEPIGASGGPAFVTPDMDLSPDVNFADMDHDGDRDIHVTMHDGSNSYWIENTIGNDAEGVFSQSIFKTIIPTALASGDIDGDGTQDIVIGHISGAKIFHNDGHWTMENLGVALDNPHTIILSDVDKDGFTDILVRDSRELVLAQSMRGVFGSHSVAWPNLGDSDILGVGDFDLTNSTMEIVTVNAKTGTLGTISHNLFSWQAFKPVSSISVAALSISEPTAFRSSNVYVQDNSGNTVWFESNGTGNLILHPVDSGDQSVDTYSGNFPSILKPTNVLPSKTISPANHLPDSNPDASQPESLDDLEMILGSKSVVAKPFFSAKKTMMAVLIPPHFDFTTSPDLILHDTHDTHDNVADYSDSTVAMHINLAHGEASDSLGHTVNWLDPNFDQWVTHDDWTDTDHVTNAIGSEYSDDIFGNEHANHLDGNDGDDYLFGKEGNDTILGGHGTDVIFGGEGDDIIAGQHDSDVLFGDDGNDLIYGDHGQDIIFGNNGDDTLLGGTGNDFIFGGDGNDLIHGGDGADLIFGDTGSDTFHYVTPTEGGDWIADFTIGEDSFEFEFGTHTFHTVTEHYTGDLGIDGEAFVWETTGDHSGDLYYDPDTHLAGDETLIAHVDIDNPTETMTVDSIEIV